MRRIVAVAALVVVVAVPSLAAAQTVSLPVVGTLPIDPRVGYEPSTTTTVESPTTVPVRPVVVQLPRFTG